MKNKYEHRGISEGLISFFLAKIGTKYWPERSLSYLCRGYDNLQRGQKYEDVLPVIHIGFLDYTPFPEAPEFYSKYMMTNIKNNHVYSDKFELRVVNLKGIELATEEEKAFRIDDWARLFKAETWEELRMLAGDNEYLQEAAEALYVANADEIVRQQCQAREDAEKRERTLVRDKKSLESRKDDNGKGQCLTVGIVLSIYLVMSFKSLLCIPYMTMRNANK